MKKIMAKVMLIIVSVFMSINTYAYDFEVDGISYNIVSTGDRTCEVTQSNKKYSGVLTIPETVVYKTQTITVVGIGMRAFEGNKELIEINLPSTLTTIGNYAFLDCSKLKNIILPQSLNSIGEKAFSNCSGITNIIIPKSVTKIGAGILNGCNNLKSVIVDSKNNIYDSRDNCNAVINTTTNELVAGCSTTVIPESVTALGSYCLSNCELPKTLNISKKINKIEWDAFEDSYGSTELIIEDSDQPLTVCMCVFNIKDLSSAYIGRDLLYEGGESLFSNGGVSSIKYVTFGPQVTYVHSGLFKDCKSLETVSILGEVRTIGEYAFCKSTVENAKFNVPNYNSITIIGTHAFEDASVSGFRISENLTELGASAFIGSKGLSSELTIPKSLEVVEARVFCCSSGVSKLIIPKTVSKIGEYAFLYMDDLKEVVIENSETRLNFGKVYRMEYIFGDSPIKKVFIDRVCEWTLDYNFTQTGSPFSYNKNIEEVKIGNNIKMLNGDFEGFENLKFLDIGNQFESFSGLDFYDCKNITRIYSRNPTPPKNVVFEQIVYMDAEVKVPKGSLAAYQADTFWRNFWNISEMDFSGIESAVADEADAVVDVYNLQGVRVRKGVKRSEATQDLPQGIYIINGEKVIVK